MHDLYEGIELNKAQTEAICRGLMDLAAVDGVHETEMGLVADFYTNGGGDPGDLEALSKTTFDLSAAAEVFKAGGDGVIESFLISCYLLIYADGKHSDEERTRIGEYGAALGLDAAQLEELHVKARLYLLQMMATHIRNKDAIRAVGADLGLTDDVVAGAMNKEG